MLDRKEISRKIAERNCNREPVSHISEDEGSFSREMAANRFIKKHGLAALCQAQFNPETGEYAPKGK